MLHRFSGKGKQGAPEGQYFAHTKSHWQDESTFIDYILEAIIPFKDRMIVKERLLADQKVCFILDLHWSHKTLRVLNLLKDNNIVPVFIPAGCTDLHQVCDLVMNKPFKNAVVNAFITHVAGKYKKFVDDGEVGGVFRLNMALSDMKPQIPVFVAAGVAALKTDQMIRTIAKSFADGGLTTLAMEPATIAAAREAFDPEVVAVPIEVEEEEQLGPVEEDENGTADKEFDVEAEEEGNDGKDDEDDGVDDTGEVPDVLLVGSEDQNDAVEADTAAVPPAEETEAAVVITVPVINNAGTVPVNITVNVGEVRRKRQRTANTTGKYSVV